MRIKSNDVVILDVTDTKKIDIHISSNHPTVQIHNPNNPQETFTPDWSTTALELKAKVYMDSTPINSGISFKWSRIIGDSEVELSPTTNTLTISTNDLKDAAAIRYKCTIEYNNEPFSNEISFARVDVGKDGIDGYTPQKGVDYFDGSDGKDGTSVTIEGVAYSKTTPVSGTTIDVYSDVATTQPIKGTSTGESYLVDGYLCVYNANTKQFICTGKIQGPQGQKGESTYLFTRYADDQNGTGFTDSPIGKKYIGFFQLGVCISFAIHLSNNELSTGKVLCIIF